LRTCSGRCRGRHHAGRRHLAARPRARGWALLTALLAALLVGLAGMTAQVSARVEREREREDELLRAGAAIARALASYRASPLAPVQELPKELAELVEDRRGPRVLRHLRTVPLDPATARRDWIVVREAGRVVGVRSSSTRPPLRKVGFPPEYAAFEKARTLGDWTFTAAAAAAAGPPPPGRPTASRGPSRSEAPAAGAGPAAPPVPSLFPSPLTSPVPPASASASPSARPTSQSPMQTPSPRPNPESPQ
jgi:hypothetical protein